MDALIVILTAYKAGTETDKLAAMLHENSTTLHDTIARTRKNLRSALEERWWHARPRPQPLTSSSEYPYIALLVDGRTQPCYRPSAPFGEAKKYFDVHNNTYGIKNEVAVLANAPHYAMFVSPYHIGSVHDYAVHKV